MKSRLPSWTKLDWKRSGRFGPFNPQRPMLKVSVGHGTLNWVRLKEKYHKMTWNDRPESLSNLSMHQALHICCVISPGEGGTCISTCISYASMKIRKKVFFLGAIAFRVSKTAKMIKKGYVFVLEIVEKGG